MRGNPTEPERRLWMALRTRRFEGYKFRRQAVIGNRIVDFFCPAKGLVIEIDGETHDREVDRQRDEALGDLAGYVTLRFTNRDVMTNLEGVLTRLGETLTGCADRWTGSTTPRPPPLKRRGRSASEKNLSSSEEGGGVGQAIRQAAARLGATSDTARLDAELLMAHALGVSRSELLLHHMDAPVPPGFAALVGRRAEHEPIAYILGRQEFYGLEFRVGPDVLIPRADSETLVETALHAAPGARRILDCGTGSGALLLAVLAHLPRAQGVGIDNSPGALAVARGNAEALGLADRAEMVRADWTQTDWAADLPLPFDLVLANPPYVETSARLAPSVRAYEPGGALFAGVDGLDAYRVLVPQLPGLLAQDGVAVVEIGASQAETVSRIAEHAGFACKVHRDLADRPRIVELSRVK